MKAAWLIVLVACAKPAGGPLSHTFDNTRIASIALEAKQPVAQAQQQHDQAVLQHRVAEQTYQDSEVEQEVAEHQAEQAVLVSQLVALRLNEKVETNADTAALARRAAAAKVEFMRARRDWLRALASSTFYAVYATQAKLELESARVAQSNNLAPAGFDLASFEQQLEQRDRAARDAAAETSRQHQAAEARLSAWNELERSFMQSSRMTGPSESDRAVIEWKQTATPSSPPTAPVVTTPAPPADNPVANH